MLSGGMIYPVTESRPDAGPQDLQTLDNSPTT
jgi:hypothetical protein